MWIWQFGALLLLFLFLWLHRLNSMFYLYFLFLFFIFLRLVIYRIWFHGLVDDMHTTSTLFHYINIKLQTSYCHILPINKQLKSLTIFNSVENRYRCLCLLLTHVIIYPKYLNIYQGRWLHMWYCDAIWPFDYIIFRAF